MIYLKFVSRRILSHYLRDHLLHYCYRSLSFILTNETNKKSTRAVAHMQIIYLCKTNEHEEHFLLLSVQT